MRVKWAFSGSFGGSVMDDGILIGVGALIEDGRGGILLARHQPERGGLWRGTRILPGGMLRVGETIDDGIVREVAEETGLVVEVIESEIDPTERIVRDDGGRVTLHVVYIVRRARVIDGTLAPGSDVGEAVWASRDKIEEMRAQIHPDTLRILGLFGIEVE
jgi:ADP-ribose pyrophosphatase YjhB (NUDIX family)